MRYTNTGMGAYETKSLHKKAIKFRYRWLKLVPISVWGSVKTCLTGTLTGIQLNQLLQLTLYTKHPNYIWESVINYSEFNRSRFTSLTSSAWFVPFAPPAADELVVITPNLSCRFFSLSSWLTYTRNILNSCIKGYTYKDKYKKTHCTIFNSIKSTNPLVVKFNIFDN